MQTKTPTTRLFPALLRHWRNKRGLSQLDLALAADVSARHISFLETGRSSPSAQMVLRLAATLDVSLRHANEMLRAAGHEAAYPEPGVGQGLPDAVVDALSLMKTHHEPFPLLVMNRAYDLLDLNAGALALFQAVLPQAEVADSGPMNLARMTFDPHGAQGAIANFAEVGPALLWRIQREVLAEPDDGPLRALLDEDVRDGRGPTAANIPRLEGHILPARSKAAKREVVERTTELPTAKAHEAEGRALRLDARASSRWWVPNPSIGGGYKGVDLGGGARAHGFVFTLSVPIPAVDRQRGDRTRAAARSQSLGAQASLAANEASGQAAGLWEEVVLLSRASETLAEEGTTQSAELITAAEAAYVGGEIGVMELLDAYRSATNTDLSVLELAMDARLAEIDLSRLTEVQS